jgi:microcystin-dependent protein
MSEPYIGEIRIVGFNFAPVNWAFCDGQILAISQNDTLFNLIGTTYGGDGQTTFALPNLQSRFPVHVGPNFILAQTGGEEDVTLIVNQIPAHTHTPQANSGGGTSNSPANNYWANWTGRQYSDQVSVIAPGSPMNAGVIGLTGGSQPHENRPPFLVVNFIIALFGVYPSPS